MQNALKKLFTNDIFFAGTALVSFLGGLFYYLTMEFNLTSYMIIIIRTLCVVALYISYWGHSKNIMKGMMGSLLMANLLGAVDWASHPSTPLDSIFSVILLIMVLALFVNHYMINLDHKASPSAILANIVISLAIILTTVIWTILYMPETQTIKSIAVEIYYGLSFPCMILSIVCVESRLDAYRLDRESAGWTEEKGYPEGYAHEYEKK